MLGKPLCRNACRWLILAVVLYAMICMLHWPIGFTLFTQLSNLFVAAVTGAQLLWECRRRVQDVPHLLHELKFTAVISIVVTFFVYAAAIAPMNAEGIAAAYLQDHGASLCMHLFVPVLAVTDFYLRDAQISYRRRSIFLSCVPPFLYFLFILILGGCGMRWFGGMAAPYPFLNYLAPAGWFGMMPETFGRTTFGIGVFYLILVMLLLFLGLGWIQWKLAYIRYTKIGN